MDRRVATIYKLYIYERIFYKSCVYESQINQKISYTKNVIKIQRVSKADSSTIVINIFL